MNSCFIVSVQLGSEFVFDIVELDFKSFDQPWDWVASRVFGFVPLEVVKILSDGWLLFDTFEVPVVELFVLEVQVLFVDFFQEALNTELSFEDFVVG